MKPLDLFQLYAVFKVAMAGTEIPAEEKIKVAREVFSTLPPAVLCAACPATREWIGNAVLAEIKALETQENDRIPNDAEAAPKEGATVRQRKARKEPLGE